MRIIESKKRLALAFVYCLATAVLSSFMNESAAAASAQPTASIGLPATTFIGQNYNFTVNFSNASATQPGFGPYVDLYMPVTGNDGHIAPPLDGSDLISANYLGSAIVIKPFTLNASRQFVHPYAKDSAGAFLTVTAPAGFFPGDKVYVLELPFGSFSPFQPTAPLSVTASLSNLADANVALPIAAVAGFRYGNDALDNPTLPDPSLFSSPAASATITPTLLRLQKTYIGPEDETATGPNFPRQYTIGVAVAPGQVITNLDITDLLPNNMQFVRVDATTGNPAPVVTNISTPVNAAPSPGGTLTRRYSSITGTGNFTDAVLTFTFYIPEKNTTPASILPPTTGAFNTSLDTASATGSWIPIDIRDLPSVVNSNVATHTLTDKSLAIQKTVADLTNPGASVPGDTLEYTLQFQVSDYFAFDNVFFTDTISDGQHFDTTFTPTMQVNGNSYVLAGAGMNTTNYSVLQNWTGAPPTSGNIIQGAPTPLGQSIATFNVSNEITTRGADRRLVGGKLPPGGGAIIPDIFPITFPQTNGPTTVTIVFRTKIQDKYTDNFPSGNASLDPRDSVSDAVSATGDLLNNATLLPFAGPVQVTDTSAATVVIVPTILKKSIYAINGVFGPFANPKIAAGDVVTYRLEFSIPFGDVEVLRLEDYLPLPIFTATEVTAFDSVIPSIVAPAAGFAHFMVSDTFFAQYGPVNGNTPPAISYPANSNSVKFSYNTFDFLPNTPLKVDLLFSVTVSNQPFADKLFLTNQVQATEGTTNNVPSAITDIVMIQLTEPLLQVVKGVVKTNDARGTSPVTFSPATTGPAGISFNAPGTVGVPFTGGTINSTNMTANPINSDASNVDGNDLVTFVVTVENQGTGQNGAFKTIIKDTLPAGFQIPPAGAGLNLRVFNGAGTAIPFTNLGPLFTSADFVTGNGIQLTDAGPLTGAIGPFDPANGKNIAVIAYDLQVISTVNPNVTITNTASVTQYTASSGAGAPNFVGAVSSTLTDMASVTTLKPSAAKVLTGTSFNNANDSNAQATIGEAATYTVTITVPEGDVPAAHLIDTLDAGLEFVNLISVTPSGGVTLGKTPSAPGFVAGISNPFLSIAAGKRVIDFDFGTIHNGNVGNSGTDTVVLVYRAVVLDVASNIRGATPQNSAQFSWTGNTLPLVHAPVTIIEPTLQVGKSVLPTSGDAGNALVYTIVLSHTAASNADAFDVTFSDPIPPDINATSIASVVDTSGLIVAANFQITGVIGSQTLSTTAPFDFALVGGRTITIAVNAIARTTAFTGQIITNTATVKWNSLHNVDVVPSIVGGNTKRTSTGGVDNYVATGAVNYNIFVPAPVKNIIATSQTANASLPSVANVNHVTAANSTIGEIVRFHLASVIAEGTTPNLIIRDDLPAGMQFINDGTAKVAFVTSGAGTMTSSTSGTNLGLGIAPSMIGSSPDMTPTFVIPPSNIGSNNTFSANVYGSGSSVFFGMGTLLNSDNDVDSEFVVIEFNALVVNVAANIFSPAKVLNNTFTVDVNNGTGTYLSGIAAVTIVEPKLAITKTAAPAVFDAGDTITYSLDIVNNGNAIAYGIAITDPLDTNLNFLSATFGGTGVNVTLAGSSPAVGANGTVTINADSLAPAGHITVSLKATAIPLLSAQSAVNNTATVKYTSVPPAFGTANATGSVLTVGANPAGSATGWRDGTGLIAPDTYVASQSANLTSTGPLIDKKNPSVARATIGDLVTYDILVTLPEGVTRSLTINDTVPTGMSLESFSTITTTGGSPLLSANFGGVVTPVAAPVLPAGNGVAVAFTCNNVTVAATSGTTANQFVIRVNMRVLNVITNQIQAAPTYPGATTTYNNTANLTFLPGVSAIPTTITDPTPPTAVTLREPVLTVAKTIKTAASPADAGGVVQYQVVIANPANVDAADANQVVFTDTMPLGLLATSTTADAPAGTATITSNSAITGGGTGLTGSYFIPVGGSVTIVYNATIQNLTPAGQSLTNAADVKWNSQPAGPNGRDGTGGGVLNTGGILNDYDVKSSATFTTTSPSIDKQNPSVARATIGDLVTYDILVTLPEGVTRSLTINDTVPTGMSLESFTTITSGAPLAVNFSGVVTPVAAPVLPAGNGVAVAFTCNNVTVPGTTPGTTANQFIIRVNLRVLNVITNQIQAAPTYPGATTTYNNTANLTFKAGVAVGTTTVTDPTAPTAVTLREPVLTVAKTIKTAASPADAGGVVQYQVVIANPANVDAADANQVVFTDTMPLGLLATSTTADAPTGGATITLNSAITGGGTGLTGSYFIPVGGTVTIVYNATIQSNAPAGGTLTNAADVKWNSQPAGPNGRDGTGGGVLNTGGILNDYDVKGSTTFTTNNVSISKSLFATSEPSTLGTNVTLGEVVTYDIKVTLPEGTTPSLVVSDTLPAGLVFIVGSPSVVTTAAAAPLSLNQDFSDIATLPVPVFVQPGGPGGGTFTATFSTPIAVTGDNNNLNNSFVIRFQARVRNIVANAGLTVPTQTTLSNAGATTTVKAGAAPVVNAPANVDVQVVEPNLIVTKSFAPSQAAPGDSLVITFVVTNTGLSNAFEPIVTDVLDANFVSITLNTSPAGYVYNLAGNTVTFTANPTVFIAPLASVTFKVNAVVKATAISGTVITNTVTVSNPTTLPGLANQPDERVEPSATANANFTIITPDIRVLKNDGVPTTTVGSTLTYTITVFNDGLRDATNVTVLDTIPPNTVYILAGSSAWIDPSTGLALVDGAVNPSQARIIIPTMVALSSQVFTFKVKVNAAMPAGTTQISNTVTANDDGTHGADPTPLNNTATDIDPLTGLAPELSITKTDGTLTTAPNAVRDYTLVVTNNGNIGATGVKITETIPANTTFVVAGSDAWLKAGPAALTAADPAGTVATVTLPGSLAVGASATLHFVVMANATFPAGTMSIVNNTSVTDDGTNGPDPIPGNNFASDTDTITGIAPELSITKTDGTLFTAAGATRDYTLVVTNNGNVGATGVVITETVPTDTTFVVAGSAAWLKAGPALLTAADPAGTVATVTLPGSLAPGASATLHFVLKANAIIPAGTTTITNTASVTDDGTNGVDPIPANNSATDIDTLTAQPDLVITKADNAVAGKVSPGQTLTYTLTVQNVGNQDATGVQVKETVPLNTTFVSAGSSAWLATVGGAPLPTGAVAGTLAQINFGNMAAGAAPVTFTFVVLINATVPAGTMTLDNTATTNDDGTNGPDPTPPNNTASVSDTMLGQPDLKIVKSDGGATVIPGGNLVYTLTYSNVGPKGASNVTIHETVPVNTTFVAAGSSAGWTYANGAVAGTTGTINVGTVNPGNSGTVTFVVKLNAAIPLGTLTVNNTATIDDDGTNGPDLNPPDNTSSVTTPIPTADLKVTKIVDNATPGQLTNINYTISVLNLGPNTATGVVIADMLPAGLTFVSATPSQGTYNSATGLWTVGSIIDGATTTLGIKALVAAGTAGQTIINNAHVQTTTTYDPVPPNDTSSVPIVPLPCPVPAFVSAPVASPSPAVQGQTIDFSVAASDADSRTQTYTWNFGDGTTGTGPNPQHSFATPGNYTVTVTATNDCGSSVSALLSLTIIPIDCNSTNPAVKNPPSLTASATGSLMAWSFTAVATDIEDGNLTNVSWNFGDGVFGFGTTVSHTYTTEGVFFVTAMVMDKDGNCRETILEVNPILSPNSTAKAQALQCTLLNVAASFKKTKADAMTLVTQLPVPAGFNAAGKSVVIQVAGLRFTATLDLNSRFHDSTHAIQFKHIGQNTFMTFKISREEFKKQFGMIVNANIAPETVGGVGVLVAVDGNNFAGNFNLTYTSKMNISAALRK